MKVKLCSFVLPLDRFTMAYLSAPPPLTQFVSQINLAHSFSLLHSQKNCLLFPKKKKKETKQTTLEPIFSGREIEQRVS